MLKPLGRGARWTLGQLAVFAALLVLPMVIEASADDGPEVDASPEAKRAVARFASLLHGSKGRAADPFDAALSAVVTGTDGAAAVAVTARVSLGDDPRKMIVLIPPDGDTKAVSTLVDRAAHVSIDYLMGGILPYPWDSWSGTIDNHGVLHVTIGTRERPTIGIDATLDDRGLPVTAWVLQPTPTGALERAMHARLHWEATGSGFRLMGLTQTHDDRVILETEYAWTPADGPLPRQWSCYLGGRTCTFTQCDDTAQSAGDEDVLGEYRVRPQARRFVDQLIRMGDRLLAPTDSASDTGDLCSVALGAIFRAEPSQIGPCTKALVEAGTGPCRVVVRALIRAGRRDARDTLAHIRDELPAPIRSEVNLASNGLPDPLGAPIPTDDANAGAAALDRCWILYYVSGDPAALRPIITTLQETKTESDPSRVIRTAARWSLVSNARRYADVRSALRREIHIASPGTRVAIEEILRDASPSNTR